MSLWLKSFNEKWSDAGISHKMKTYLTQHSMFYTDDLCFRSVSTLQKYRVNTRTIYIRADKTKNTCLWRNSSWSSKQKNPGSLKLYLKQNWGGGKKALNRYEEV